MKIYTKTGDHGETGLLSGQRIQKNHPKLAAYGDIDELNSLLGSVRSQMLQPSSSKTNFSTFNAQLEQLQMQLFTVGSHLACDKEEIRKKLPQLNEDIVIKMETWIDEMEKDLPPLKNFILPGGSLVAAQIHTARAIARRAERASIDQKSPVTIKILNRLSDYLFVLARKINQIEKVSECIWDLR